MNSIKLRNGQTVNYETRIMIKIGKLYMFKDRYNNLYCENPEISKLSDEEIEEAIQELMKIANNDSVSSREYELMLDGYYRCLNDTLTELDELLEYLQTAKRINRNKIKTVIVNIMDDILNYV